CMVACDNAASSGCVAFTYVGGALGSGSGSCYLKNSVGSFTGAANNLVSGSRASSGSTSGSVTTTTSSAASAATTYADGATPSVNGVTFEIQVNVTYSGQTLTLTKKRAAAVVGDCLNTCSQSTSCVGTAFDGSVCTYFGSIDNSTKVSAPGTTFATVEARSTATSTSSSSTGVPSASLCPSANGQTVNGYTVSCSSDTNIGSYSSANAVNSYLDCMSACNAAASTGCVAFTYVGGNNGIGPGACYLKNIKGSFTTAGGPNYIAGMIASQTSSSSSSSSISSTQSGSASSSVASSSSSTATSSSATASASSSLCPSVDSQDMTDSNGQVYTIHCQSDTDVGSFANAQAANTYADCMTACDSTTGCVAFTYVGGAQGQGSGTCWMKNSRGSATSAGGNNYVAGFLKQSTSTSSASSSSASFSTVSSTTVSSSATASSSASASLCPQANGQIITDANGNTYNVTCSSDNNVGSYTNAQASSSYLDCMTACDAASSSGCQGFTYVGGANGAGSGTCWLKTSMGVYTANGNNFISAVLVTISNSDVVSLSSSSSSVSSSIASSSTASSSSTVSSSSSVASSSSSTVSSSSSSMITSSSTTASSSSSTVSSSSSSVSSSSSLTSSSSTVSSSSSSTVSSTSSSTVSSSSSSSTVSSSSSSSSASSSSSSMATTLSTSTASASGTSSTALSLPTGFSSYGCFIDSSTRALSYSAYSRSDNTPYKCASTCQSLGYKYAGTEYGSECWCSNTAPTSSAKATDCNMACSGDSTQTCGAGNRLSVYVDNTWVSKFNARQSYGTWNLMACYTDNTNGRVLPTTMSMTGGASNATIANCLDACAKSGLKVCGAEYYQECYGGSVAPSSSLIAGSDPLAAGCNYPCNGNKTEACGGSNKILVYVNNGTVSASAGARRRW
ncbi:WSC-domain-containing protein, partial [Aureobasidium melanogenum]